MSETSTIRVWAPSLGFAIGWLVALLLWVGPEWPPTGGKPGLLLTPGLGLLLAALVHDAGRRRVAAITGALGVGIATLLLWRIFARLPWWETGAHLLVSGALAASVTVAVAPGGSRAALPVVGALAGLSLLTTNSVLFGVLGLALAVLAGVGTMASSTDDAVHRLQLTAVPGLGALLLDGVWLSDLPAGAAVLLFMALGGCAREGWEGARLAAILGSLALAWSVAAEGLPINL